MKSSTKWKKSFKFHNRAVKKKKKTEFNDTSISRRKVSNKIMHKPDICLRRTDPTSLFKIYLYKKGKYQ